MSINQETLQNTFLQGEHRPHPVMTTGLESSTEQIEFSDPETARRIAGLALSNGHFIVGQPVERGNGFLSLESGQKVEEDSFDEDEFVHTSNEKLEDGIKREVYDFVSYLINEKSCDINLDAVSERLSQTKSHFMMDVSPDSERGIYKPMSRQTFTKVEIQGQEVNQRQVIHTAIHEAVHAASGNVFVLPDKHIDSKTFVSPQVIGLERNARFRWLNEGMTETITQSISKMKGVEYQPEEGQSYRYEKALLHAICRASGISLYDFAEAYFEEPDLHSKSGERMPKWHKLQSSITEAFGPKFLVKIDEMIKSDDRGNLGKRGKWDSGKIHALVGLDEEGRTEIDRMHEDWISGKTTSS